MPRQTKEEIWNIVTHALGIILGIAALIYGLYTVSQSGYSPWSYAAIWVYGLSFIILYICSTVYHSFFPFPRWKAFCRRFDHAAIYIMIAGSYTPYLWISLRDGNGFTWSALIWGIALVGICFKLFFAGRFKLFSTICYLLMGWLAAFLLPELWQTVSLPGLIWLALGGVFYTVGSIFYMQKKMPYAHPVWHVFVLLGSVFQWFSIQYYVLPGGAL